MSWNLPTEVSGAKTRVHLYSAADILRQESSGGLGTVAKPFKSMDVNGALQYGWLSHSGRYLAGTWAPTRGASIDQSWLSVIDLQAGSSSAETVYEPPGGRSEQVERVQWISDTEFIVRNASGRKFYWAIGRAAFTELKSAPASYNGYTIVSELYAPDGLKYGGLMSKDSGQTHEVWISNPDYTDMRQITNAGLKLSGYKWIGDSSTFMVDFNGNTITGVTNRCNNSMVRSSASMLSAQQLVALPMPGNLPCVNFTASLLK